MEKKKVIVAGAGLAGCLMAIGLKQQGYVVELFEKRQDMRKDSSGPVGRSINLILTKKGMIPLEKLGLLEKAISITTPVYGRMMHDLKGELTYQPYGKDDEKNFSIPRSGLNILLLNECDHHNIPIHFEAGLDDLDIDNGVAIFNGQEQKFDHFIGADGAGSVTRAQLLKHNSNLKSELIPLGSHYKEMSMPSVNGDYAIDKNSLHIWPRGEHMLMALPNQGGSFTMTVYMPEAEFDNLKTPEAVESYFKEYYPDVIQHMPEYQEEMINNPQGFLGSLEMSGWIHEDKLCLIGDAAHAIVPFFGQGMNCAFSDVNYLLVQLEKHNHDWQTALNEYQAHQKPNGDAIRQLSIENFEVMCKSVGDEKYLFQKAVENIIEKEMPELFRSRYAKVVYTDIPYHVVIKESAEDEVIIEELCKGLTAPEQVDLVRARELFTNQVRA